MCACPCRARRRRFRCLFLYCPDSALGAEQLSRALQQRGSLDAQVEVQQGWAPSRPEPPAPAFLRRRQQAGAGGEQAEAGPEGARLGLAAEPELRAVLLSPADAEWPLLAAGGATVAAGRGRVAAAAGASVARDSDDDDDEEEEIEGTLVAALAAPARLRRRLEAVAGPLATLEADLVLVSARGASGLLYKHS